MSRDGHRWMACRAGIPGPEGPDALVTLAVSFAAVGVEPGTYAVPSSIFLELTALPSLCIRSPLPRRSTTYRWNQDSGTRRVDRQSF